MNSQHSMKPWSLCGNSILCNGKEIGYAFNHADAALIVTSVNASDSSLNALRTIAKGGEIPFVQIAEEALAAVRAEQARRK